MNFKKCKRKPSYVDMAEVTFKQARDILDNGLNEKRVSFSEEDIKFIKSGKDDEIAGFIATDGDSYWFVNINYAKEHYEIDQINNKYNDSKRIIYKSKTNEIIISTSQGFTHEVKHVNNNNRFAIVKWWNVV